MLTDLLYRLRAMFRRKALEEELDEELQFHLEHQVDKELKAGLTQGEAMRRAKLAIGGLDQVKEECRQARGVSALESTVQDLRYALRVLRKSPGFTLAAVLSLALGIGGNSAMFSVIHAMILRPPPYQDVAQLVMIGSSNLLTNQNGGPVTSGDFLDWRKQARSFEQLSLCSGAYQVTMVDSGSAERIRWQPVTTNLFDLLGVRPVLGRSFSEQDGPSSVRPVILSHEFWQRRFGGDPNVLGRMLTINGPATVIGAMPRGFQILDWGEPTEIWYPLNLTVPEAALRRIPWLACIGRLNPRTSIVQAQAEMSAIAQQLEQAFPDTNKGRGVFIEPLQQAITGGLGPVLYPLFGAVGFVLLIACANVANLLLARAGTRRREIVVRAALGAGRARLIRQLLTESVLLAVFGGLVGIGVALGGIRLFEALAPSWLKLQEITLNVSVAGFTLAVSVVTGVLAGLAPAIQTSRPDLNESLKEAARASGGRWQGRTRAALVAGEVALALILLAGAGLMLSSLVRLLQVDPGFKPVSLLTMHLDLSGPRYVNVVEHRDIAMRSISPQVEVVYEKVLQGVRNLPGVESVSLVSWLPHGRGTRGPRSRRFVIGGRPEPPPNELPSAAYNMVSPDYFQTMRIPLIRGGPLSEQHTQSSPWVVVINEAMARKFWPSEDPIGQVITIRTIKEERPRQIVGIVGNVRQGSLSREPNPEFYALYSQQPPVYGDGFQNRVHRNLVVRTTLKPESLIAVVRAEVMKLDRDQPVYDLRAMEEVVASSTAPWRFYLTLLGVFAGISLLLAAIGIYGVVSYAISERTQEIGIRMALGAGRRDVLRLVFYQGLKLTAAGLAVGLAGSLALTRFIVGFLYGVKPSDPLTFAGAILLLGVIACAAIFQPAWRATRVDPSTALRKM
jgi:putative ABC transport system permease protein